MSHLVCHVQKFKANDVRGMQIHNQRESPNSKNKDIDHNKIQLNYDLKNDGPINYNKKVKEIMKNGYVGEKAIRKDAVVLTGTLITSDAEYFKTLSPGNQKKFFESAFEKLQSLYGENNIVSAVIHMDENTPHMHVCSVPLTEDGKLAARNIFNRYNLLKLQEDLPKYLQSKGFDIQRGKLGSEKKHVDTNDFKKNQVKELSKELDKSINTLRSDLMHVSASDDVKLDKIPLPFLKDKIAVSKSQFETNLNTAKLGNVILRENEHLKSEIEKLKVGNDDELRKEIRKVKDSYKDVDILRAENESLKSDNTYFHNDNIKHSRTIRNLNKKNKELSNQLKVNEKALNKTMARLGDNGQEVFKQALEKEVKAIEKSLERAKGMER